MQRIFALLNTGIGKKFLMALSGLILFLFLVGHLLGNLLIFQSPEVINQYAHWLQSNPLLWLIRLAMLSVLFLHIYLGIQLSRANRRARPIGYAFRRDIQMNPSAKFMLISGIWIALFIGFHIVHLTLGWLHPELFQQLDSKGVPHVYQRLVSSFQSVPLNLFYLFSLVILGVHLSHALKSLFQTLGFHHKNSQQLIHYLMPLVVIALCIGFVAIPISILFDFISLEGAL